ncbi:MAG: GNAT family N-acetyltransferase, partial [Candidatus Limosilactobacillus intestinavium]
ALYCHAQMRVKPFYDVLGYETIGEPFDEGGVEHVMMKKDLK